jgi:uncharacterized membrane protein YfcA
MAGGWARGRAAGAEWYQPGRRWRRGGTAGEDPPVAAADALWLVLAAAAAGAMNAMAGGGTILTYPALRLAGLDAITANATSTVALLPGALGSLAGYRREVAAHRAWLRTLVVPSVLGGTAGGVLLLATPERTFARLAPALVLFATALFAIQGAVRRRLDARQPGAARDPGAATRGPGAAGRRRWMVAAVAQLLVAVYGGYFGAGIGILMLAVLGFLGLRDIHAMNGLKNVFGFSINVVAALYFAARGAVAWPAALLMAAGAVAGGYGGARLARRVGQVWARRAVVLIGVLVSVLLVVQESR